jgi:acetylornithine deacetylase/succinyl-diaminopimelate desuccinylase-like protein
VNASRAGAVAAEEALKPLFRWLRAAADAGSRLGVAPGLRATGAGWCTAAALAAAPHERLGPLIAEAERRWGTPPHVAAAVWWKQFSYWGLGGMPTVQYGPGDVTRMHGPDERVSLDEVATAARALAALALTHCRPHH